MRHNYNTTKILIRGMELDCHVVIEELDDYRYSITMHNLNKKDRHFFKEYCHRIGPIQNALEAFSDGEMYISDFYMNYYEEYCGFVSSTNVLPDAIYELFDKMENEMPLDLTELFNICIEKTKMKYEKIQKEELRESNRINAAREIVKVYMGNEEFPQNDIYKQIEWIGRFQELKKESDEYKKYVTENELKNENMLTVLYSEVLLESTLSKWLQSHLMQSLVVERFVSRHQVESILKSNGFEHDYEWYSEDFMGSALTAETLVDIGQLLNCCKSEWDDILGICGKN